MLDKTFEPKSVEDKHYKRWEDSGVFAANVDSNRTAYTIPMPPPNVTGSLHMGHALTMTLQDILTRYRRMRGDDTLWQPGTDHAGIATQMVVERELNKEGIKRQELGREKFLEKVWEWKEQSGNTITTQLRRLGASPDWERERFTMDDGLSDAVKKVFVQLYKEGLIYKDKRLVNWDPKLHTAVSDLEVSMLEKQGHMWNLKYPLTDDPSKFIEVGTTRPETMLGDSAVAVHPEDERYKDLIGKTVTLPLVGREIPIVADDYADPEQGTGAVKITPAHDFNDFEVGRRHDLELINILDADAKINENAPAEYQGMDRFDARKKIIEEFEKLGLLGEITEITHSVPYDEKSKQTVLEPWLTDQWYCDAATLAKPAIEAVEDGRTEFVPKNWEKTYFEWMRNIQPWCISRQLWWGHRIPAWYADDGQVFVAEDEEDAYAQARKHYGKDDVTLTQDEDVLDTWFSSALWPFSTLGWPEQTKELGRYYPADTLITGFDIIFFWVARMMMMGLHFMGDVPFRKVYIHALVRDEHGQKMSKTKGNIVDPLDVIDEYGADALRFTLTALAAQGRDIKLAPGRVEGYRNFATKLWNVARYCEMNDCKPVADFDPAKVSHAVNRWIVSELALLSQKTAEALDAYKFNEAANHLYHFAWGTFCDWYVEMSKPLLQGDDEAAKAETRATAAWVFDQLILMLNPVMPFISEELHAHLHGKNPDATDKQEWLLTASWPEFDDSAIDRKAIDDMDWVIRLITTVRRVRGDMNVPPGAFIHMLLRGASDENLKRLDAHLDIIKRLARLESITPHDGDAPQGSIQDVVDEATIILPLADVIDMDQERARLKKEIEKVEAEIGKIKKKLSNENFLQKAPEEVVAEQKSRQAEAEDAHEKLMLALKQLGAA
ncbi:MAG: valine--tRNA ligase [Pseudomonadota bacterium]|nr:valine--tRNA ligase [Pseudomonadota bacterium]QKK06573.1 MAG: valine--tRNA ligase [Pseudomonadota bacterium]